MSATLYPPLPLHTETNPQIPITIPNLPPRTLSAFIASYQSTNSTPSTPSTTSSSSSSLLPNATTSTSTPRSSTTTNPNPTSTPSNNKSPSYTLTTTPISTMPFRSSRNPKMVETRTTKPTLLTRLRGRNAKTRTTKTTTTISPATQTTRTHRSGWGNRTRKTNNHTSTTTGVHHRRHATIGDKISGAMMKLKGSLTRRPGVKAAGTRRMHGTDRKGSHRTY